MTWEGKGVVERGRVKKGKYEYERLRRAKRVNIYIGQEWKGENDEGRGNGGGGGGKGQKEKEKRHENVQKKKLLARKGNKELKVCGQGKNITHET